MLIEIFKPERGSCRTSGRFVSELPLFSPEINWIHINQTSTNYVLDICPEYVDENIWKFSLDLLELCNKMWDKCIKNNMDFYSFKYYD